MNKNFRVITINGIRGILTAVFIVCGLIAGFIISPGFVCMKLWNRFFEYSTVVSSMNIYQGIMLWGIIVLSVYAISGRKSYIGFGSYPGLSPEQLNEVIRKTRAENPDCIKIDCPEEILKEIKAIDAQMNARNEQSVQPGENEIKEEMRK